MQFDCHPETKEHTTSVVSIIKDEIKNLKPERVLSDGGIVDVKSIMHLTMVDGKVCQVLTDTPSTATCYICGAKPVEMNNLNKVKGLLTFYKNCLVVQQLIWTNLKSILLKRQNFFSTLSVVLNASHCT